jgi:hypothetical protein
VHGEAGEAIAGEREAGLRAISAREQLAGRDEAGCVTRGELVEADEGDLVALLEAAGDRGGGHDDQPARVVLVHAAGVVDDDEVLTPGVRAGACRQQQAEQEAEEVEGAQASAAATAWPRGGAGARGRALEAGEHAEGP